MEEKIRFAVFGCVTFVVMIFGLEACSDRPRAAGDYDMTAPYVTGPCEPDGATRACHIETGRAGNIVNCFSGTQVCTAGQWGACGGTEGEMSSIDLGDLASTRLEGEGTLSPLTVSATGPSRDAGACRENPCNPYCHGVDVDADSLQPEGGASTGGLVYGTVATPDTFPGGLDGPKNAMGTFAIESAPARVACNPSHPPSSDGKSCSSDYCCAAHSVGGTPYTCQPWANVGEDNPIAKAKCTKATGVDFTLGLACNSPDGHVHVPACNRGTADATSGTVMVAEYPGNPRYAGDRSGAAHYCNNPGSPSAYCFVNLATKSIPAGKCLDIDVTAKTAAGSTSGVLCTSGFSSGNSTMMINPPSPPLSWAASFTPAYPTLAEGNHCNNYSFHPSTPQGGTCSAYGEPSLPGPMTQTFTYKASCLPGYRVVWNQFGYETIVPSASEVIFKVSTAPSTSDGGSGTFTSEVTAAHVKSTSSPDPAVCSISGYPDANACPKNLATILGVPAQNNEMLKVSVTQISTTAISTVKSWRVSYSCVPYE